MKRIHPRRRRQWRRHRNLSDLQGFASAYLSTPGDPNYNPAADFNQDGIVNLVDAKALMQNMAPVWPMPLCSS